MIDATMDQRHRRQTWLRVRQLLRPYRGQLLAALVAVAAISVLGVIAPLLIRLVFDRALFCSAGCLNSGTVVLLVVVLVAVPVLAALVAVIYTYLIRSVGHQLARDLRVMVVRQVDEAPRAFRLGAAARSISAFVSAELEQIEAAVSEVGGGAIGGAAGCLASLAVSLLVSWQLSLILLPLMPAFAAVTGRLLSHHLRLVDQTATLRSRLAELVAALLAPTPPGGSGQPDSPQGGLAELDAVTRRLALVDSGAALFGLPLLVLVQTLFAMAPALAYLGYVLVLPSGATRLSVGTLVAFTALQLRFLGAVGQLLQARQELGPAEDLVQRSLAYDQLPSRRGPAGSTLLPRPASGLAVEFDGVWVQDFLGSGAAAGTGRALADRTEQAEVATTGGGRWSLRGASLALRVGEVVALVGPAGSSRAMVSLLLQRGVDPAAGTVRVGGCDLRTVGPDAVAEAVVLVGEGASGPPFKGTVRDSLAATHPESADGDLERAARAAGFDRRIERLPQGWDTPIGDGGYRLEAVDRRLLEITRAHLEDPYLLILDDPTHALEPEDAALVARSAGTLVKALTTVIIADRLPAIATADLIIVVENGRVSASGSQARVMAESQWYAETYRRQMAA